MSGQKQGLDAEGKFNVLSGFESSFYSTGSFALYVVLLTCTIVPF